ncbi:hypothetical protein [Thiomicrorhabdus lithotrophica]|uniref:Uncharacterized protein n=1 Tax=Thiomicrorhabdus lithotrophica TaxID=2949997 RepID=A0ABY8C830_9GAMM|nr:hypothetical protein [Thiomicrorhabdus lithotrophica]WEJ62110.1 hypothetical protein NR989_08795 [Thiomicrorhabdus lithotrophica]
MIKNMLFKSTCLGCIVGISAFNMVYAADADFRDDSIEKFQVVNNQVTPLFKTLFLSQEARKKIDKQREAYLNPPVKVPEKKIAKVEPKSIDGKPKKKRIYIPPKVAISAVIIKPDGSTIIRVNNKYDKSPSKHINLDTTKANTNGVPITVNGKTQVVPVGSTLLTRKNKLIDTYKLNAQSKKSAMPKTEQKAVKQTLEQVQILNAAPKQ